MYKLLIDTCVWLDIAKDPDQQPLLNIIEGLIEGNEVEIILPEIVVFEFNRNKDRIVKDSAKSLSGVIKRVKDIVDKVGDPKSKKKVLAHLIDVDHKIPLLGESVSNSVEQIDRIFKMCVMRQATDNIRLAATQRAIEKKAPFHHNKNSINDAIIIEMYGAIVKNERGSTFGFVTHNKSDFSLPNGSDRVPHPDFSSFFSRIKSQYFINLSEALQKINSTVITQAMIDRELALHFEPRAYSAIAEEISTLSDKLWYDRHKVHEYKIQTGKITLVDEYSREHAHKTTVKYIWDRALKNARRIEKKYGIKNLGPYSKFDWGMLNGKLSALRWVLGDEWDFLDT